MSDLVRRAERVEACREEIRSRSARLGTLYAKYGETPDYVTVDQHIEMIYEDNLKTIDEAVYGGAMNWFQAAALALNAMGSLLDGENDG